MTSNKFDLLDDVDSDDHSQLIAAAEKKAAAKPAPAAPAAKLPTKPPPPGQAVQDGRNFRDGAGRGRGGRGGRTGPRRDYGDADANGFQGGYGGGGGGGFGGGGVVRGGEDGEGRARGPRQPYRGGGGRRGGYTEGQTADEFGRPHRSYERRSGTGREYGMKRDGAGRGNWGTATDEGLPQENVEAVNTEEAPAVAEDEKKPEDAPQTEVDQKVKEGAEKEEEEKEAEEDKEMTLEEYEKVLEEKRNALLALKAEERKVEVDKELQSMQQLSVKKDADEVFIKLGSDKDLKKKENAEKEERAKKSVSINEFLKPAEGERYNSPGGRGRGRGLRGRGEPRGGYNGGGARRQAPAPAIEDQAQFPSLGGK
ncbi:hypothetical protein ACQ4PT_017243 [Festuca glaucescens]